MTCRRATAIRFFTCFSWLPGTGFSRTFARGPETALKRTATTSLSRERPHLRDAKGSDANRALLGGKADCTHFTFILD